MPLPDLPAIMASPIARAVLLVFGSLPVVANAQSSTSSSGSPSEPVTLAPVVVTTTRAPQKLADSIAQTTLFDQQDIADSNATDVAGLLALAPGVQITRNGGPGSSAGLFLRGASSAQSLVLIDGVRVESA